jgi:hypothetical protein
MHFVIESITNNLISCDTNGIFTRDEYDLLFNKAQEYSKSLFDHFRNLVKNKYIDD